MRRMQIGLGMGLALALSSGCSFYLPEKAVCTDGGCKASDMGVTPDMARDPNDPSAAGPYKVASLNAPTPPSGISALTFLGPSNDGTTLSTQETAYPLVLMAPPQSTSKDSMRAYADRLASHGFLVVLYESSAQLNHTTYLAAARSLLDTVLTNSDANIKSRIDSTKLGLVGYELGGKISAAQAAADTRIGALFLIDPVDVPTGMGPIDGPAAMGTVTLAGGSTAVLVGAALATTSNPPCVQQNPKVKSFQDFYDIAKAPAVGISFGAANLGDFVDNFYDATCIKDSTAPRSRTQDLTKKYMTAYLQWSLKARARSREYLLGTDFSADQQTSMVTRQTK